MPGSVRDVRAATSLIIYVGDSEGYRRAGGGGGTGRRRHVWPLGDEDLGDM